MTDKPRELENAFTSQDCDEFAYALDIAWTMFLRSGRLTPANLNGARAAPTLGIRDAAGKGELNMQRLAILAVQHFYQFYDRLQRPPPTTVDAA